MALKIYNTLTREKELFEPLVPGRVNMYVRGPTDDDYPHIGHAKTYAYFDVGAFPQYGKLSNRSVDDQEAGARVEIAAGKRDPADFAIWKKAEAAHIMRWPSPWGEGFPGWHIECSAMAMKYLGETIDLHTGGIDHLGTHHTNEIAQSEAATHKQFVKYWVHTAFMLVAGEKMSKSLGNIYRIYDLEK